MKVLSNGFKRSPVRNLALVKKEGSKPAALLCAKMEKWFAERNIACLSFLHTCDKSTLLEEIKCVDVVLVLGGDGTFVSVARKLASNPLPLLGVNLGRVGFLAEIAPNAWEQAFGVMLDRGLILDAGIGLEYSLHREGRILLEGISINDLVVSRGGPARLISLGLTVDGLHLTVLRADGLIISTPTGSTGYTGSARGPLLHPGLAAYAVTAICPFMSNFLPMVVASTTHFSIKVDEAGPETYLTVDGQEAVELKEGDILELTGRDRCIRFGRINDGGYFAKLRQDGFVRDFAENARSRYA